MILSGDRDWRRLHDYILGEITEKLALVDYIRFGSVCKSWRIIFLENPYKKPSLPGLIIPTRGTNTCNFYSLVEKKAYDLPLRMPLGEFSYYGSSFGWLITLHWTYNVYDVRLVNPFSYNNQTMHLPPLSTDLLFDDHTRLRKFALSANPATASHNYEIMGIFGWRVLVYLKAGRKVWASIKWKKARGDGIRSLMYFKKTKQFYAVDGGGAVVAVDVKLKANPKLTQVAQPNPNYGWLDVYIVETAIGELLQVHREDNLDGMKCEFYLDKLDQVTRKWIPLLSLGDHMLFLSPYYSSCLSPSEFPVCKANCIYSAHYSRRSTRNSNPPNMRVFNLEDRSTEAHFFLNSTVMDPVPIWLEPIGLFSPMI